MADNIPIPSQESPSPTPVVPDYHKAIMDKALQARQAMGETPDWDATIQAMKTSNQQGYDRMRATNEAGAPVATVVDTPSIHQR